ncbi:MAG TPA: putative quinol monooxygenase [Caulobacteraceae bacterium]|jgi:quinol monooxygenase YgiN
MLGIVATLRVQDGKGPDFEAVFLRLAAKVRADEPGNLLYQLTRSRTEPNTYKVLELYKDEDAIAAHRGANHFREIGAEMGPFMAGRPDVEILDGVE